MMIWALDQHVEQFVKLSEIHLERGNIFAKCLSNQGHEHRAQTQFWLLFLFNIQFQPLTFKTNFQFNLIILTTSVKAKVEKNTGAYTNRPLEQYSCKLYFHSRELHVLHSNVIHSQLKNSF